MPLVIRITLSVLAFLAGTTAAMAQCTVSSTDLAFGVYEYNFGTASTGDVSVNCDAGIGYTVELSQGFGTFTQRKMMRIEGAGEVFYNLYTRADYLEVWGDGTQPVASVQAGTGTGATQIFTVFGLAPSGQQITAGNYNDIIVVTVRF